MRLTQCRHTTRAGRISKHGAAILGAAILGAAALGSCASAPPSSAMPQRTPMDAQARAALEPRGEPGWDALPPEARACATEFAARIERGDWAWVAAAATDSFKRSIHGSDAVSGAALALLLSLRTPPRAGEEEGRLYTAFVPTEVKRVRFTRAELLGPVAVISGNFERRRGEPLSFELRILYRLDPPRILGEEP